MHIGIVSGGSTDLDFCYSYLENLDCGYWIGVDKGLCAMKELGIIPNIAVGDFDSADGETVSFFKNIDMVEWDIHPPEKDETDIELAVRRALKKHPEKITVLGGTGTRFDHTFAALSTMLIALDAGVRMEFVDPCQRIYLIKDTALIKKKDLFGPYISFLAPFKAARGVTLEGFKYPMNGEDILPASTRTVSNEADADIMRVVVDDGVLLCVEAKDSEKAADSDNK